MSKESTWRTTLSSHPIPGNEESISKTINRLLRRGANVIYDAIAPVHVSGHASQEEQKLLLNMVKPKHFMPIHGELRQLKRHGMLAVEVGIPEENVIVVENGQVVELTGGKRGGCAFALEVLARVARGPSGGGDEDHPPAGLGRRAAALQ